ncbi:hypothetical protein Tco_0300188 [Tanacetum coccineum]
MSDSNESGVTYTEVSSPFEGLSDIGLPRADDHEYLKLPWMPEDLYVEAALQAPPSPDYVPGLEEPEQAPPLPDYVPGPKHADDEIVVENQLDAEDASPTAQSPDYDEDGDVDMEADEDKEEEEHPAPADSVVVALPSMDQASSAKAYRARISIPALVPSPVLDEDCPRLHFHRGTRLGIALGLSYEVERATSGLC